ncbi:MAG: hypothetical protein LAQ30_00655 [Acidobacteriia bacterium]|nr:hypothetical protein [Terriglobia bacterium]
MRSAALLGASSWDVTPSEGANARPRISHYLVGNNVWMNPSDAVWSVASKAGLQIVRIGGGAYDRKMPPNDQLVDWLRRIKAMGAEPMVQVSQYGTAREAADLVRFLNVENKFAVRYWNLGNEPWLQRKKPPIGTVAAEVAAYVKPIASAMKAVDPSIKIYIPDECDYFDELYESLIGGPSDVCGKDENNRHYVDGISWHRYVSGDRRWVVANAAQQFRVRAAKCRNLIDRANAAHGRAGAGALGWGIGEYNLENRGFEGPSTTEGAGVHSFVNGQFQAEVLGICMKYGATYCSPWSTFENGGRRQGTDYSFIDGQGLTPRPSYRHMELVAKNFRGEYLDGATNLPDIRAFGCKRDDGLCAMILNMEDTGTRSYTLRFDAGKIEGACAINLDGGLRIQHKDDISNQTTQLLVFSGNGTLARKYTYGVDQAKAGEPPKLEEFKKKR